ncbi:hypothetical protein GS429_14555 [Natronorubrum sp. JWXQ-INN-674]|uniref:Potassium transporter TrkA n=1 Tax=Natronorubrum halalkaliphilum TaxID=2691917 RepID=A0A6B0VP24_9EURY|nr:hypothetical protein [Natronorubrum halalkaliphilum]MXV63264.1 hypothetical protein [Natronorubrum halalkaliphilum]
MNSTLPIVIAPVEILTGVSIALLFGIAVAAFVGAISFGAAYFATERIPSIAGGLLTVLLTITTLYVSDIADASTVQPGLVLGLGSVGVLGLYATSRGRQLAADLPRATAGSVERTQPLAADAIDAVDAMGQVTIRSSGGVREFDGYPPLGPGLRKTLENGAWRLPADLPLSALETRLGDRLRTSYDLEAVSVAIDGRGRASITAAPPASGVATQVPDGWRAVSTRALLPAGLAPGDAVLVSGDSMTVSGTVLSATVDAFAADGVRPPTPESASDGFQGDGGTSSADSGHSADAVAVGGEGCVTVAVPTTDAETLLDADRVRVVVTSRGTTRVFDALSLLERSKAVIRRMTLTESVLDAIRGESDLTAFAVRRPGVSGIDSTRGHEWQFEPEPDALAIGMEAFVIGDGAMAFGDGPSNGSNPTLEVSY